MGPPVSNTPPDPGVTEALTQIYEAHFDHVWRALRRFGVESRHLEDVAQEVFVVVHRRLPDFQAGRPIKPWLTGIAFRCAADHRGRASVRREQNTEEIELVDDGANAEELLDRARAKDLVYRALAQLNDDQRLVFVMHDLDGCSMPEIAAVVDVPLNTLYSRLRLARAHFTRAVTELKDGGALVDART